MKLKKVSENKIKPNKPKLKKIIPSMSEPSINFTGQYKGNFPLRPKRKHEEIIRDEFALQKMANLMNQVPEYAFDTETNTLRVLGPCKEFTFVGLSVSWGENNNYYIPIGHLRDEDIDNQLTLDVMVKYLKKVFERTNVRIYGWNLKFDFHVLARIGINVKTHDIFDGMLASWLCDENTPNGLKENSQEKMYVDQTHFKDVTNSVPNEVRKRFGYKANSKVPFSLVLVETGAPYAIDDAFLTWCACMGYKKELEDEGMDKIYYKKSVPFLFTLYDMEERGVSVDVPKLEQMGYEMQKDIDRLQYRIYEIAGVEFNIGSVQQKAEILYGWRKPDKIVTKEKANKKVTKIWTELSAQYKQKKLTRRQLIDTFNEKMYKDGFYSDEEGKIFKRANVNENLLKYSFDFKCESFTDTGNPATDADAIWRISKRSFKMNKRKQQGVEMCKLLLEYSKIAKLKTAFVDGILEQMYDDGKVHPSFNQIGTDSGRLSCISKGSLIETVGGRKPIEDIKIGDLVYCYDEEMRVKISKVVNTMNNGVKPCLKITWKSQGTHSLGTLICTPDHKILTKDRGWVEAIDLQESDVVCHIRRSQDERPRIYGANSYCEQEQLLIKREYFNVTNPNMVIHHSDENKNNNEVSNFEIETRSSHTSHHSKKLVEQGRIKYEHLYDGSYDRVVLKGKENPNYLEVSKEQLEDLVHQSRGIIRSIPMDFDTFKKKCEEVGFDYKIVASQYQKQYNTPDRETFLEAYSKCKGVKSHIMKELNIGRVKCDNLFEEYGVCTNHKIVSIEPYFECEVYDLEVEKYHNFIASEICVHNCSAPNLQQLPKAEDDDKYQIRSVFIGSINPETGERNKILAFDYKNLEMMCLTHFSKDENLLKMFNNNEDAHGSTAVNMFNLDCDSTEVKKKYHHLRQAAKIINFMLMYGGGAKALYEALRDDHDSPIDLGSKEYLDLYHVRNGIQVAQIYIDKYFESYKGVAKFIASQKKFAHRHGYVLTILGRKRRLPDINSSDGGTSSYCERLSVNSAIQGTAGDITISAQNRLQDNERLMELGCVMLIQVHDEVVFECPEENIEEATEIITWLMEHPFGDNVKLNLALQVDSDSGNNYQEAK